MAVQNRKYIEDMIYSVYDALDPSHVNTNKYRDYLSTMSDPEFEKFFKNFLKDDKEQFMLDVVELERKLEFNNISKAAKIINVPLMEYVYMPHLTMDKQNIVVSKEKCLVGYGNLKRTQQLLHKKNGLSTSNEKVSALTNQVTGNDKNSRDSDIEATLLVALGAEHVLQELHGPRADDTIMKRQLKQSIATKGYASLSEMDNSPLNKVTLNTVNTYFMGMGIKSDIISDSYIFPKTSDELFN